MCSWLCGGVDVRDRGGDVIPGRLSQWPGGEGFFSGPNRTFTNCSLDLNQIY